MFCRFARQKRNPTHLILNQLIRMVSIFDGAFAILAAKFIYFLLGWLRQLPLASKHCLAKSFRLPHLD